MTLKEFKLMGQFNYSRGSDGAIFHPNVLPNETLFVFAKDLCQSMPLVFDQEVSSNGLPGYRSVKGVHSQ